MSCDPASISGMLARFRASDLVGLNDGDPVGTWPDTSGNGNDATQADGNHKPLYKTNLINSKPGVRFDGISDYLQLASNIDAPVFSFFAVMKKTPGTGYRVFMKFKQAPLLANSGSLDEWGVYAAADVMSGSALTSFKAVIAVARAFNDIDLITDGSSVTRTNGIGYDVDTVTVIGANTQGVQHFLDGDIAELIFFNKALSATEVGNLGSYAVSEYALTVANTISCDPVVHASFRPNKLRPAIFTPGLAR